MAGVLLVSSRAGDPLPELTLLAHALTTRAHTDQVLAESATADAIVIDARGGDLVAAKATSQLFASAGVTIPRLVVLSEGGLAVYSAEWGCTDFILDGAGPAEYDARLRLLVAPVGEAGETIAAGGIVIDELAYAAHLHERPLDLTYTEFELLKYLVQHPGRVFSRAHLLAEVWGYDYYGGTRTVDVHVRRLRSKLGVENENLISTVRNVGYRFSGAADGR